MSTRMRPIGRRRSGRSGSPGPTPTDAALPAAGELLGGGARALLHAAVRSGGGELISHRARQVLYRPGHELVVRYDAVVRWRAGSTTDERAETLIACHRVGAPPPGTVVVAGRDGVAAVGVWRYPFDPVLGALS